MSVNIISQGNLFDSKAQTLVNTVNCVGIMGKGIALEFKNKFPDMFEHYIVKCKKGAIKLGRPYLYKRTILPWILLFPTKKDWRSLSNLYDIEEGLKYLLYNYKAWGITSLAIPPLGCGLGGLEWNIVGKTLYNYLSKLEIPVELYAPQNIPSYQATSQFLINGLQTKPDSKSSSLNIEPGVIVILEVLNKLNKLPYHWPIGRTMFQKLCYFGTHLGLKTSLTYIRGSYGPFSSQIKQLLTKLQNNKLIVEKPVGRMFKYELGETFCEARERFKNDIESNKEIIGKLVDLFCRFDRKESEIASTVHFAWMTMRQNNIQKPSELDLLNEVLEWKKRRRPPIDKLAFARTIRNLAVHNWIDVQPSKEISSQIETEAII